METKTFDVLYYSNPRGEGKKFSHKYTETWVLTDFHCPACGNMSVWAEDSPGDYYVGEQYICVNCKSTFHMPGGCEESGYDPDVQRLTKLSERV